MKKLSQSLLLLAATCFSSLQAEDQPTGMTEYYQDLPESVDNLMVIHDPLNWMIKVLDHKKVRELFNKDNFPKSFSKKSTSPDLESWIKTIESQATWIPEKSVIGISSTFIDNLDAQVKAFLYGMYFKASQDLGAKKDSKDVLEIKSKLIKNIQSIQVPEMHLWARFRSPMTGQMVMQLSQIYLNSMKGKYPFPLPIEMSQNEISMKLKLADYLPSFLIKTSLLSMGLGDLTEEETNELVTFCQQLSFELKLVQKDSILWFQIKPGETTPTKPLAQSPFPDMGRTDSQFDIFSIKWSIEDLIQHVVGWNQIINTWKETSVGIAVDQMDKTGSLNSITHLAEKLEPLGTSGYLHYWHDKQSNWEGIAEGFRKAPGLSEYQWPLPQLSHLHSWVMDNSIDLSTNARMSYSEIDQKITQLKMQNPSLLKDPKTQSMIKLYDEHLSKLMLRFLKDAPQIFKQGYYYGFDEAKETSQVNFSKEGEEPLDLKDLKVPKFIFLTQLKDASLAKSTLATLNSDIEKSIYSHYLKNETGPKVFTKGKIKNQAITTLNLNKLFSVIQEDGTKIKVSGDIKPHYFIWNDHFVFSSSKTLTENFLTETSAKAMPMPNERITQAHAIPKNFSSYVDLFSASLGEDAKQKDLDFFEWMKQLMSLIETVNFQIDQHDDGFSRSFKGEVAYPQ